MNETLRFTSVMSRSQIPYGGILLTVPCLPLIMAASAGGWAGVHGRVTPKPAGAAGADA